MFFYCFGLLDENIFADVLAFMTGFLFNTSVSPSCTLFSGHVSWFLNAYCQTFHWSFSHHLCPFLPFILPEVRPNLSFVISTSSFYVFCLVYLMSCEPLLKHSTEQVFSHQITKHFPPISY